MTNNWRAASACQSTATVTVSPAVADDGASIDANICSGGGSVETAIESPDDADAAAARHTAQVRDAATTRRGMRQSCTRRGLRVRRLAREQLAHRARRHPLLVMRRRLEVRLDLLEAAPLRLGHELLDEEERHDSEACVTEEDRPRAELRQQRRERLRD